MTRALTFPYTPEFVARSRREICERFPAAEPAMIEYGVACEVIINVFGPEWYRTRLAGNRSDTYFAKDRDRSLGEYIHQARVTGLAHDLLVCQHFEGFAELREEMSKRALLAVYHELRVARMLHDDGHRVAFVVPSHEKGQDFDLLVDDVLATEVKAKEEGTQYTTSSLQNTLLTARPQLPPQGPGLVALRIPDAWGVDPAFAKEAEAVFRGAFSSRRINAILVLWDEWAPVNPKGAACLTRFRVFENPHPRTEFPDLPRVIRSIAMDGSLENSEVDFPAGDWTFACAVRRYGGPGPLFETFDGALQMVFDRAGLIANRIAGEVRVTSIPISTLDGRWVNIMLRFGAAGVDLRVGDAVLDFWSAPSQHYKGLRMMPEVDADLREHVVYSARLTDQDADRLFAYLSAKGQSSYIQFRRGDVARFRVPESA